MVRMEHNGIRRNPCTGLETRYLSRSKELYLAQVQMRVEVLMSAPVTATESVLVACEVCLKEIPRAESTIEEVDDYVMYFCGLGCYQLWRGVNAEIDTELDE